MVCSSGSWVKRGGSVRGFTRAVFSGPTTPVLSRAIADIVERHEALDGLWHLSAEPIAKHDLLVQLRDAFELDVEIDAGRLGRDRSQPRLQPPPRRHRLRGPELAGDGGGAAASADDYTHLRQGLARR